MDVVFEYCRLVDRRKIAKVGLSVRSKGLSSLTPVKAHPLVKTFSNEVLPQAPSPLDVVD